MTCQYCGQQETDDDAAYCATCLPLLREAVALLLAGLADLFAAQREQEAAEKQAAA
jgi:hypothetical protein